jgi:vibriolysin
MVAAICTGGRYVKQVVTGFSLTVILAATACSSGSTPLGQQQEAAQVCAVQSAPALASALREGGRVFLVDTELGCFGGLESVLAEAGLSDTQLIESRATVDAKGRTHVRHQQELFGLPVIGGSLVTHHRPDGTLYAVNGQVARPEGLEQAPGLDGESALAQAAEALVSSWETLTDPSLVYVMDVDGEAWLAWTQGIQYISREGFLEIDQIFADATTGALVARHPKVHGGLYRTISTANNTDNFFFPEPLFEEGGTHSDPIAVKAYDNSGLTYNFYHEVFGRDSFDDAGANLNSVVHVGGDDSPLRNNAAWIGDLLGIPINQMIYGDGDGVNFLPFVDAFDVAAHELTHAISGHEAGLVYQNEPGAINETFSDVMAAAAEAWVDGGVNTDTWLVGEDIFTPDVEGDALRYMNDPTKDDVIIPDEDPALISSRDFYPDRYLGEEDNGGVHINSGIGNLAFYLMVEGGKHPQGKTSVEVPALDLERASEIFYHALNAGYLTENTDFEGLREATAKAAGDLYGANEITTVHLAWNAVGVPGATAMALFTANPPMGYAPLDVEFQDQSIGANSWSWNLGDGSASTDPSPTHRYDKPGSYPVTLTINGNIQSAPAEIFVAEPFPVDFKADKTQGNGPLSVQFENLSSGDISGYTWDFGDGTKSSDVNPAHEYTEDGEYTVTLTAEGPAGPLSTEKVGYIRVGAVAGEPGCSCAIGARTSSAKGWILILLTVAGFAAMWRRRRL